MDSTKLNCKSVLIVEKDHESRVAIRRSLEEQGYFVISSGNALEALQMIHSMTPPTLVLLSQDLPMMNGNQFAALMRRVPGYLDVPVAQIKHHEEQPIESAFCAVTPNELGEVMEWLRKVSLPEYPEQINSSNAQGDEARTS